MAEAKAKQQAQIAKVALRHCHQLICCPARSRGISSRELDEAPPCLLAANALERAADQSAQGGRAKTCCRACAKAIRTDSGE